MNFGEVSGAQIKHTMKLNNNTPPHTNIAKLAPPLWVKIGSKKVQAAAPILLIVIQVPTPVPRILISNSSVG